MSILTLPKYILTPIAGINFKKKLTNGLPDFTRILALQYLRFLTDPVAVASKILFKLKLDFICVAIVYVISLSIEDFGFLCESRSHPFKGIRIVLISGLYYFIS